MVRPKLRSTLADARIAPPPAPAETSWGYPVGVLAIWAIGIALSLAWTGALLWLLRERVPF
jgi:hypothetical protein